MSSVLYVMDILGILRPLVTVVGACAIIALVVYFLKRG